jgi:hypothetical protein
MNRKLQFMKSRYDQNEVMYLKDLSTKKTTYVWKREKTMACLTTDLFDIVKYT